QVFLSVFGTTFLSSMWTKHTLTSFSDFAHIRGLILILGHRIVTRKKGTSTVKVPPAFVSRF
ncbi:hypothetical protein, partial [Marinomonas pollencensis]